MKRFDFNGDWKFVKGCVPSLRVLQMYGLEAEEICLPHDAMIHELRDEHTKNGGATGFYPGGTYTYFKTFFAPAAWAERTVMLEFEGVYQTAMVYLNGVLVKTNRYGYSNFYADLTRYLKYDTDNEVRVIADNASEQNSRWYSGSGIYRSVRLHVGELIQIPADGVRVTTREADREVAVVEFSTNIRNLSREKKKLTVSVKLTDNSGHLFSDTVHLTSFAGSDNKIHQQVTIPMPQLWSCDSPHLYECIVQVSDEERIWDEEQIRYGIRKLSLDAVRGLQINGETVKLRGTCVHHDNGILGAATHEAAELRKCELIRAAGFNSVRSSHQPADKAFLDACDRVGLLVMDEMMDMWTNHKNDHDFAFSFLDDWQGIAERMVAKDYNHPSVILYSVGNEIAEIGTERGAEINRMLCNYLKELDNTRFTTNGMNALNAAGASIYPILKELAPLMNKGADTSGTNDSSGSNAMNSFMKLMEGEAGDAFAVHPLVTEVLRESSESMDIIGLNYLTGRHLLDGKLYPNKCVLGTETFPADIARLWKVVCSSSQVLGDFTWTGYDYLGEAGCGIFYYDERANFGSHYPDRAAYIGDLDLTGSRRPVSFLREIVYGLRKEPYIAVERVDRFGKEHTRTPWMLKDNISSWTWRGYEGQPANVDVYSPSEYVELFLNGQSLGRKRVDPDTFTAAFQITYQPGELRAVGLTGDTADGAHCIRTASDDTALQLDVYQNDVTSAAGRLAFISISHTDASGVKDQQTEHDISVHIEGNGTLLALGSADPSSEGNYFDTATRTFDGCCMAVVAFGDSENETVVDVVSDGTAHQKIVLHSYTTVPES